MKKTIIVLCAVIVAIVLSGNYLKFNNGKDYKAKIYYVDHSMLRLIPVNYNITDSTEQKACEKIIGKLIEGEDYNNKIMRVIPDISNGMDVDVDGNTAYVNFSSEFVENIPQNNIHSLLMIYSIVNSLTSVEDVNIVKFRFDGEEKREYIGGVDMREAFIPDYCM